MNRFASWLTAQFIKRPAIRRATTRLLEGDCEKQVHVLGLNLTVNTLKEHGYLRASRLCKRSSLLRDELAVIINLSFLLGGGDTFVDIGANVGVYSLTVERFQRLMPSLRIYAFEANPDTYARLAKSAGPGVALAQVALAEQPGELEFTEGAVSHIFTTVEHADRYHFRGRTTRVQARRLDEAGVEGDSLVLKVDVEGQELAVLRGAEGLFRAGRVKAVYVDGYKDRGVETLLIGHGFRLLEGQTLTPTEGGVFSLLAVHSDKVSGAGQAHTGAAASPAES